MWRLSLRRRWWNRRWRLDFRSNVNGVVCLPCHSLADVESSSFASKTILIIMKMRFVQIRNE
jgi:hypothetical protein